jgi:glucosyl-3-phosphoglycerate phosphatase
VNPDAPRLLLVRHGESVWNAQRKLQGQQDLPLSAKGRIQAQQLAPVVHSYAPDFVIASDLQRARETAELIGYPAQRLEPMWREAFLGEWEGALIPDLRSSNGEAYNAWRDGSFNPPNAESFQSFCERIRTAIDDAKARGRNVLVVTHGGAVRAAMTVLFGMTPNRIVPVSPASLTVMDLRPEPKLRAYNLTAYDALFDPPD